MSLSNVIQSGGSYWATTIASRLHNVSNNLKTIGRFVLSEKVQAIAIPIFLLGLNEAVAYAILPTRPEPILYAIPEGSGPAINKSREEILKDCGISKSAFNFKGKSLWHCYHSSGQGDCDISPS